MKLTYTKELIESKVKESRSFRDLTIRLGIRPHGGSIMNITKKVQKYGIDVSHFTGNGWARNTISNRKTPKEEILSKGKQRPHHILKRALFESGVPYICAVCGLKEWMKKPLYLEIDHIDGVKENNEIDNIRFICSNCHSQTKFYRYRGRRKVG